MVWESLVIAVNSVCKVPLPLNAMCVRALPQPKVALPSAVSRLSGSRARSWDKWQWKCTQVFMQLRGEWNECKTLKVNSWEQHCVCAATGLIYAWSVLTQVNTALFTFVGSLSCPYVHCWVTCPTQISVFKAGALGASVFHVHLWQGSRKEPDHRNPAGLQVSCGHSHFWKQRPGCLVLRFLYSIVHKSIQDSSDTVSLGWVCIQVKISEHRFCCRQ